MSGVTGEIGFKIGAAASQLVRVDQIMTATAGGTALQAIGPVFVTGVMTISTGLEILNTAGTTTQFMLTLLAGTNVGKASGLQVRAGNAAVDVPIQVIDVAGTGTLLMVAGDGHGNIGWNYTAGKPILKTLALGQVDILGGLTVTDAGTATEYHSFNSGGASISCAAANTPLLVYESGTTVSGGGNWALRVDRTNVLELGTSTVYTWGTGTHYPTMQFAGVGAIFGTGTIGLVLLGGGMYYNGTNYIYGQAGTGVQATLGTGSFTISCFNTSGTAAGTATPTVVFSVGGTVTSNAISGYGPAKAALVDMTPDRWVGTATINGMGGGLVFGTATVSRSGQLVNIWLPVLTGTGTAVASGGTCVVTVPMPAAFQNSGTANYIAWIAAHGTDNVGGITYSGTTFQLFPGPGISGTFTGTLTNGLPGPVALGWPVT